LQRERGGIVGLRLRFGRCFLLRFLLRFLPRFLPRFLVGFGPVGGELLQRQPDIPQAGHQQQDQRPVRRPTGAGFRRLRQLQQNCFEVLVRGAGWGVVHIG
jgi:hypothetical protein